ncbi:hypothetical protein MICA_685 [Micavibrio aeruginosavorus ARL-13]|uniref:Uncharacterized protein n=1 Tax=Micavibrio aeruginosavorus (strain ARL-13) TaxID=856793 RepID=G2KPB8_MICAA|nr:hypothetical protein MICA_685 [Micavibrio aeruginosavorus ARL-13]
MMTQMTSRFHRAHDAKTPPDESHRGGVLNDDGGVVMG